MPLFLLHPADGDCVRCGHPLLTDGALLVDASAMVACRAPHRPRSGESDSSTCTACGRQIGRVRVSWTAGGPDGLDCVAPQHSTAA